MALINDGQVMVWSDSERDFVPGDGPMTTLGDIIYGAAAGAATRLPGNTTTTPKFLMQTGNGTISAAPAWNVIKLQSGTPVGPTAPGNAGEVTWDSSFIYVCIATDTWKRVAIETWVPLSLDTIDQSWIAFRARSQSLSLAQGDPISLWEDMGPDGNDATQSDAPEKPTYQTVSYHGFPSLVATGGFDGLGGEETTQWLELPTSLTLNSQSFTLIWFGQGGHKHEFAYNDVLNYMLLKSSDVDNAKTVGFGRKFAVSGTRDHYHFGKNGATVDSGIDESMDFEVLGMTSSTTETRFYVNGVLVAVGAALAVNTLAGGALMSIHDGNFGLAGALIETAILNVPLDHGAMLEVTASIKSDYALPASAPIVVFEGDSLTQGVGVTRIRNNMPNQVIAGLGWEIESAQFGVIGQTIADMLADAPTQIFPLFSATRSENVLVVWGGTNDFANEPTITVDEVFDRLVAYLTAFKAAVPFGLSVVGTMLPRTGPGIRADWETIRADFNDRINNDLGALCDAVADVGADATIGVAGATLDTDFYGDETHLTEAGYLIAGPYFLSAVAGLVTLPTYRRLLEDDSGVRLTEGSDFRIQE